MSQSHGYNNNIAIVVDCDDTIIGRIRVTRKRRLTRRSNKTLLETLTRDWYKEQSTSKKIGLTFGYLFVKAHKAFAPAWGKLFDDETTGETTSMQVYGAFMLKKAEMSIDFIEQKAKEYAKLLKPSEIEAFKRCNCDVYIVSAEPVQLLEAIVKEAGLSGYVKGVFGTEFKVENGVITGFVKESLSAGIRGKYGGMKDIVSNGYSKVFALGDSMADVGLTKLYQHKVTLGTFHDSPPELKEYVKENGGPIVGSSEEFLEYVAEKAAA